MSDVLGGLVEDMCSGHLLPYQGRDAVPQAMEGVLDVVTPASLQGIVVCSLVVWPTLEGGEGGREGREGGREGGREKGRREREEA